MNTHAITRETAVMPAFRRETRELHPFRRILFSGAASDRFQVLRRVGRKYAPTGSYVTLDEAIEARDTLPEDMPARDALQSTEDR
jgi:hypothetical protein